MVIKILVEISTSLSLVTESGIAKMPHKNAKTCAHQVSAQALKVRGHANE